MTRTRTRICLFLVAFLILPLCSWAARAVVDWEYDYVNVRSTASTTGELVGRLAAGAEGEVLEQREEWTFVRYPGGEGWVVSRSLRTLPETTPMVAKDTPAEPAPVAQPTGAAPDPALVPDAKTRPPEATPPSVVADGEKRPGGYLSEYTDTPEPPVFDAGPSVVSAISGLLIVLALIAGAVLLVRKLMGSRFPASRRPGGIRILGSRPVAPRQSLLLVEVEGLVWLVGQGPEGMRRIDRIDDPRALERLDDRYEFLETPFQSELRRTLDLEGERGEPVAPSEVGSAEELTREQRLAALRRRGKPADGA